jgi:hypothetical protein
MLRAVFSLMGWITLGFVAMLLLVGVLSAGHWSLHVPALTLAVFGRLFFSAVALSAVGLGLIGCRKWAALAFSLITLCLSFWALTDALHAVPWSWNGIGYWYGLLLISPSVLTVRYWHTLVWRVKRSEKYGNSSLD